jgi:protease-4
VRWIRRIIVGFFAIVGFVVVAAVLVAAWLGSNLFVPSFRSVPSTAVLTLDLDKPPVDVVAEDPFAELFSAPRLTLREAEEALDRAGADSRVKGLLLRLGAQPLGQAASAELRDAVASFRKRGKWALAYAESFGEGGGSRRYLLAAACDEVWLQPSGELGLTGVIATTPFLKGALDKLGLAPRFDKREEYKTAINQLTDTAYSPAFKESLESLLGSLYDQLVRAVADGRGLSAAEVKSLIDRGPFLAGEALKSKLVDRLGYRDEAEDAAKQRAGSNAALLPLVDYFHTTRPSASGRMIAFITASGPIVSGESSFDTPFGVREIGADTLVAALDSAAKSEDVAAILVRIDSPGGSYVASDTIWRAVVHARAAGKPVIVSMANVAASGGYFIAAPATKIVAEPATLTGSIGVFGGKLVLEGLLAKLGITTDTVQFGANAGIWNPDQDFTPDSWSRLEASLDAVYKDFTQKVATGRGLDPARIPLFAKGRVFTGEEAQKIGLVDALGGYATALALAREAAGIKPTEAVRLVPYPSPGHELRVLLRQLLAQNGSAAAQRLASALGSTVAALRPLIAELPALAQAGEAWLLMPPLEVD